MCIIIIIIYQLKYTYIVFIYGKIETVLDLEEKLFLRTIENRRGKMLEHFIRHDAFIKTIIEGKIEGKRERERLEQNIGNK